MRGGRGRGQICQQGLMLLAGQREWPVGAKQLEATEERDTKTRLHCRIPRAPALVAYSALLSALTARFCWSDRREPTHTGGHRSAASVRPSAGTGTDSLPVLVLRVNHGQNRGYDGGEGQFHMVDDRLVRCSPSYDPWSLRI